MQEPQLLEQMNTTMGMYEGVAELRVKESLAKTNSTQRLRGTVGQRANAVVMADAVRLLERAADFYAQVNPRTISLHASTTFTPQLLLCWAANVLQI